MHADTPLRFSIVHAFAFLILLALAVSSATAQQVETPVASTYAMVSEQIGITDVTVHYGRPAVNGRQIWGNVVPYGLAPAFPNFGSGNNFPWRAGANENTTVAFEHDVLIEGQRLPAGTYGLHMIPAEQGPWTVIFSHNTSSWGSFFYDASEDALRVQVTPKAAPHQERLQFGFTNHQGRDQADLTLRWAELQVPIQVKVDDLDGVVMSEASAALRGRAGLSVQGYVTAVGYAAQNGVNLEEALRWSDVAIARGGGFNALVTKAGVLRQLGREDQAEAVIASAWEVGTENDLNTHGYQLVNQQRFEEAMKVFTLNVERHPNSWNPHDSLGELYATMGDAAQARKYYQMALAKLPQSDTGNRTRIEGILAGL